MLKKTYKIVGISSVVKEDQNKSFDILHLLGEPFFPSVKGSQVCNAYVGLNRYKLGESVSVISHKGDYIVID